MYAYMYDTIKLNLFGKQLQNLYPKKVMHRNSIAIILFVVVPLFICTRMYTKICSGCVCLCVYGVRGLIAIIGTK
jgi:hypothetical protein